MMRPGLLGFESPHSQPAVAHTILLKGKKPTGSSPSRLVLFYVRLNLSVVPKL
jgi:hypothetical protein